MHQQQQGLDELVQIRRTIDFLPSLIIEWKTKHNDIMFQFNVPYDELDTGMWVELRGSDVFVRNFNQQPFSDSTIETPVCSDWGVERAIEMFFSVVEKRFRSMAKEDTSNGHILIKCEHNYNLHGRCEYVLVEPVDERFPMTRRAIENKNTIRKEACMKELKAHMMKIGRMLATKVQARICILIVFSIHKALVDMHATPNTS